MLLGERCAAQMMSHPVTLSSPPPSSPPTLSQSRAFSPYKTNSLARAAGCYERRTNAVISSSRAPFPPDRDVKPLLSGKQQAPHQQICTCRRVAALLSEGTFFLPPFLTGFSSSVHMHRIQMVLRTVLF